MVLRHVCENQWFCSVFFEIIVFLWISRNERSRLYFEQNSKPLKGGSVLASENVENPSFSLQIILSLPRTVFRPWNGVFFRHLTVSENLVKSRVGLIWAQKASKFLHLCKEFWVCQEWFSVLDNFSFWALRVFENCENSSDLVVAQKNNFFANFLVILKLVWIRCVLVLVLVLLKFLRILQFFPQISCLGHSWVGKHGSLSLEYRRNVVSKRRFGWLLVPPPPRISRGTVYSSLGNVLMYCHV